MNDDFILKLKESNIFFYRYFPSKYNREIKALKTEVERLLMEIIQSRKDCVEIGRSSSYGNDLLGLLLNEMQKKRGSGFSLNLQLIMDECKTFFFAGHETTALLLTWTSMLLASNPTWQDKVRAQVAEVCNGETPSVDHLSKLTLVCNSSSFLFSLFPFLFLFLFFLFFISLASYQRAGCLATYIYICIPSSTHYLYWPYRCS